MSKEMIDKLMKTLIVISALFILAGALFKLQHWPHGDRLFTVGLYANIILSSFEISRLRRIISKSEEGK